MIGYINKIETMGMVDGPGIRTVIFMQGCSLRCLFCHNPEMWNFKDGMEYTSDDLVDKIKKYKNYYNDNGGVTFSGGEPLLQSEFLTDVSKKLKKEKINICLDTAGVGNNYTELLNYIDLVILDIKHIHNDGYKEMTGFKIDKFFEFLNVCQNKNKKLWLRQVIVPGINDNIEYIYELKKFVKDIKNVEKIELLPYHTMGVSKYKDLGIDYILKNTSSMDKLKCIEFEKILNS